MKKKVKQKKGEVRETEEWKGINRTGKRKEKKIEQKKTEKKNERKK